MSEPAIAVDRNGTVYAAWRDRRNGVAVLFTASRPASGNWGPNQMLDQQGKSGFCSHPGIAVDSKGNAHVVWVGLDVQGGTGIYAARLPAGGVWREPIELASPGSQRHASPVIEIEADGAAHATWLAFPTCRDQSGHAVVVESANATVEGTWGTVVRSAAYVASG